MRDAWTLCRWGSWQLVSELLLTGFIPVLTNIRVKVRPERAVMIKGSGSKEMEMNVFTSG